MKRVKFMLVAVATFAVVGGALAFKAKTQTIYCADLQHFGAQANSADCPAFASTYIPVTPGQATISYCTNNVASTCKVSVSELDEDL